MSQHHPFGVGRSTGGVKQGSDMVRRNGRWREAAGTRSRGAERKDAVEVNYLTWAGASLMFRRIGQHDLDR